MTDDCTDCDGCPECEDNITSYHHYFTKSIPGFLAFTLVRLDCEQWVTGWLGERTFGPTFDLDSGFSVGWIIGKSMWMFQIGQSVL